MSFYTALALILVGAPASVAAQSALDRPVGVEVKASAQAKAREARKFADKGQHEKALELFKQAYETYQEPGYLYNMGIEYQALGRDPEAYDAFERFLKDVEKIPPEFVADANQQQRELRKRLAEVDVKSTQEGAHVVVDDREVGLTPLDGPVRVRGGVHRFAIRKDGFEPFMITVNTTGGGKSRVEALMRPIPVTAEHAAAPPANTLASAPSGATASTPSAIASATNATDPNLNPSPFGGAAHFGSEEQTPPEFSSEKRRPLHLSVSAGANMWASGVPNNPQPSAAFSVGGGYRLASLSRNAELRLGAKVGYTFLSEPANSDGFISVLANPMIMVALAPKVFAFGELGLGMLVVTGVQKGSVLLTKDSGDVTGALGTFQLRPAVGIGYSFGPGFSLYATPGLAWSPSPNAHFVKSSVMTVELAAGAMAHL